MTMRIAAIPRRILFFLFAITVLLPGLGLCDTSIPPPAGLIGWWPGDGNYVDFSTNHNDGAGVNGVGFGPGKVRDAFQFNGGGQYVAVPDSPLWAFGTNDFTIQLWAEFGASDGRRTFVASDDGGGGNNKWIFWSDGNRLLLHINGWPGSADLGRIPFYPDPGVWYHVAVTRNGSLFGFYVNGVLVGTDDDSRAIPDASVPLTIGCAEGGNWFDGSLDEIAIFNRALSSNEIAAVYNANSNGMFKVLSIRAQPQPTTAYLGVSNSLVNVIAFGSGDLTYQWRQNGTNVVGQTGAALMLPSPALTDAGNYTVVVGDATGASITSGVAVLTVKWAADVPAGLVGWWPGDGYALDLTTNHNNGTLVGGVTYTAGKVGPAFNLDGTGSVNVPNSDSLKPADGITMMAWIRTTGTPDYSGIIDKMAASTGFQCGLGGRAKVGTVRADFGTGNGRYMTADNSAFVMDGQWHLIAGTYDGTTMSCTWMACLDRR